MEHQEGEAALLAHNERDADGRTALHHAALADDTELVRQLLGASADIDAKDEGDWSALHVAASAGRAQAVDVLLLCRADVNAATGAGGSALTYAASKGHTQIVRAMLAAKADVKLSDKGGSTPLHRAAARGHCAVLEMLLAVPGASYAIDIPDKSGYTPFHIAALEMQVGLELKIPCMLSSSLFPKTDILHIVRRSRLCSCLQMQAQISKLRAKMARWRLHCCRKGYNSNYSRDDQAICIRASSAFACHDRDAHSDEGSV